MTTENEKSINSLRKIMEEGDELRRFIRPKEARVGLVGYNTIMRFMNGKGSLLLRVFF